MMQLNPQQIFDAVTKVVFAVILIFLTIGIIIGTGHLFLILFELVQATNITSAFREIISQVLSLFILIELSRSLAEFFRVNRLRLTFIVDAVIVFVLRDIMIEMFEHRLVVDRMYALSVLLFVLGMLRIGSVLVYQRGQSSKEEDI